MAPGSSRSDEQARLSSGGLISATERRLQELLSGGMSSSFLSARAAAVAEADGLELVGQVVGGSACRMAVGVIRRTRGPAGRLPFGSAAWRERDGPNRTWNTARQRALERLMKQAQLLKADAVLGVTPTLRLRSNVDPEVAEVVLTGTAVRTGAVDESRTPIISLTSPQEFCLLRRAGVEVLGVAGSCASVEVSAGMQTRRALRLWGRLAANQELEDLTVGLYEARRLAIERLQADARRLGASGVIGIDLSRALGEAHGDLRHMHTTVHLLATAVRHRRRRGSAPLSVDVLIGLGGGG